jgi:hypothetical protein
LVIPHWFEVAKTEKYRLVELHFNGALIIVVKIFNFLKKIVHYSVLIIINLSLFYRVDRTKQSPSHYNCSTPGVYDCRYPPPTRWKYHFCRTISRRRRSNAANRGQQTTSLPKIIYSSISNVHRYNYYESRLGLFGNVPSECTWLYYLYTEM